MDTNDLSEQTYRAILIEAESFNHDLTTHFGYLSYECENEDDYIVKAEEMVHEFLGYDEAEIDDLFFGDPPEKEGFHKALHAILENIQEVKKIAPEDREFD
ncbi:hypothetical protein G3O08_04660 [Cryomorpha ignava]|uniref:Uncharacterized protein n=1 Tax=Cryomorpha ignava TaxID=101383 RepID=A0A7K3WP27_9FLAO|nr:hypothetical protein [Cryomorpha ignava]NEN22791.1 hypothetical protein [Cryomorpha ignava]